MASLIEYARLVRLPNVFTAMADIGLGALAVGALPDRWGPFLLLLAASSLLYCSGMVWNDWFDVDQDRKERPFRPFASGKISLRAGFRLAALLMVGGILCAAGADVGPEGYGWRSTLLASLLAAAILFYDGVAKKTVLGPAAMGTCRFLNVLLGLSVAEGAIPLWGWGLAATVGIYVAGVTLFARTEAAVSNRRMLGIAAGIMVVGALLALTIPPLMQALRPEHRPFVGFPYLLAVFGVFLGMKVASAIRQPTPRRVQGAVKRAVLGLVALDAVLATAVAGLVGLVLLVLLGPAYGLGRRLYST